MSSAPEMFGISVDPSSRVEDALVQIQDRVRQLSDRAPLWVLHFVINRDSEIGEDEKRAIKDVLAKLCRVCRVSSKSKTPEFTNGVKEIGSILGGNPELVKIVAKYAKREFFKQAFEIYVDNEKPEFREQAQKVGDVTQQYCKSILERIADEGAILWSEVDFSKEIDETFAEYETIERCQILLGTKDFLNYRQVVDRLCERIFNANVPRTLIIETYPSLQGFVSVTDEERCSAKALNENIDLYSDTIREVFFDVQRRKILELVRSKLTQTVITDDELRKLIEKVPNAFVMSPQNYEAELTRLIEEHEKNSAAVSLVNAWKVFSGSDTPDDWAAMNFIPARFLFDDAFDYEGLFKALTNPEHFAQDVLIQFRDKLESESSIPVTVCQKRFMKSVVPERYSGFNIQLGELTKFLLSKYGSQPNKWPFSLDVSDFIREQYRYSFAPQIREKVNKMDPEHLKSLILEIVETNQDVGMLFWE